MCVCVSHTQRIHCLTERLSFQACGSLGWDQAADTNTLFTWWRQTVSTMARLDQVITNIVDIFMEYADDGGKKRQLNKEELKKLLEQEIQSPDLKDKISAGDIEEAMEMLDKNHDGEVNFREFCRCVSDLAKCYYQKKIGKGGKRGKGKGQEGEEGEG
ncbi:protein S100-A6-like [Poeciliopsis prolifica]|uniref:protein S100-A6-like n=1 Tax=Poeciliopsis prolifica TaxID=188132 RepID=UPI002414321B|nr:protein S100-A6-like [Poeciliopsis prolifica]